MTKNQLNKFLKRLKASQKVIAKERDRLRDLIDEAETIEISCSEAEESINYAIDRLSELQ